MSTLFSVVWLHPQHKSTNLFPYVLAKSQDLFNHTDAKCYKKGVLSMSMMKRPLLY